MAKKESKLSDNKKMGAGIVISEKYYSKKTERNEMAFIIGRDTHNICRTFGGYISKNDKNIFDTISRELREETACLMNIFSYNMKRIVDEYPNLYNKDTQTIYLCLEPHQIFSQHFDQNIMNMSPYMYGSEFFETLELVRFYHSDLKKALVNYNFNNEYIEINDANGIKRRINRMTMRLFSNGFNKGCIIEADKHKLKGDLYRDNLTTLYL